MIVALFCAVASNVIGFDLGTENIKTAVVRSGRNIEIVLNELSKRKTPGIVSFEPSIPITLENVRKIDRRVGASALPVLTRNSSAVIRAVPDIIGKKYSKELGEMLDRRYIDFSMKNTHVNGIDPKIVLAMLFEKAAHHAEQQVQIDNIKRCVVAVPGFFTDYQKQEIAEAVELAGLELIKIIDERTSLSFVYALEKSNQFINNNKTVTFIDFGSSVLTLSGYKFALKLIPQKNNKPKTLPIFEDLGYIWDDGIGGRDFDILLAEYLQKEYNISKVTQTLLQDAERIKLALTLGEKSNTTSDVLGERILFTRSKFDEICAPLYEKFKNNLLRYKEEVGILDSVEVVGGSTRIPKIIEIITEVLGPISHSLDSEETIVTGAAYTAMGNSGFVKMQESKRIEKVAFGVDLQVGNRSIHVFKKGSPLKAKKIKFDPGMEHNFSLVYTTPVPTGASPIIGTWSIPPPTMSEDGQRRIFASVSFDQRGLMELVKTQMFEEDPNTKKPVSMPLNLRRLVPEKEDPSISQNTRSLMAAFTANEARLAKIAEGRNALESLMFEVRDSLVSDEQWRSVMTDDDQKRLWRFLNETSEYFDKHQVIEDADEIVRRNAELTELIAPIQDRASEARTLSKALGELESLADEVEDAVNTRWPMRGLTPPPERRKSLLAAAKAAREWLAEKREEVSMHDKTDDPVVRTSEVELQIKRLQDVFASTQAAATRMSQEL